MSGPVSIVSLVQSFTAAEIAKRFNAPDGGTWTSGLPAGSSQAASQSIGASAGQPAAGQSAAAQNMVGQNATAQTSGQGVPNPGLAQTAPGASQPTGPTASTAPAATGAPLGTTTATGQGALQAGGVTPGQSGIQAPQAAQVHGASPTALPGSATTVPAHGHSSGTLASQSLAADHAAQRASSGQAAALESGLPPAHRSVAHLSAPVMAALAESGLANMTQGTNTLRDARPGAALAQFAGPAGASNAAQAQGLVAGQHSAHQTAQHTVPHMGPHAGQTTSQVSATGTGLGSAFGSGQGSLPQNSQINTLQSAPQTVSAPGQGGQGVGAQAAHGTALPRGDAASVQASALNSLQIGTQAGAQTGAHVGNQALRAGDASALAASADKGAAALNVSPSSASPLGPAAMSALSVPVLSDAVLQAIETATGRGGFGGSVAGQIASGVIFNAAMMPGWPFPSAMVRDAGSAINDKAMLHQMASAMEKMSPEEAAEYLAKIGANHALLRKVQALLRALDKVDEDSLKGLLAAFMDIVSSAVAALQSTLEQMQDAQSVQAAISYGEDEARRRRITL